MGFPLSRGTVREGLLMCHWHHARFDLAGGGTLDPFADNVRSFDVEVDGDSVFLLVEDSRPDAERSVRWFARLDEGLEHRLDLVLAKASVGLVGSGASAADVVRGVGRYGLRYRGGGWGMGMTIRTAVARSLPVLAAEDRPLALFHGAVHVARDTAQTAPRFDLEPLPAANVPVDRLKTWFRRAVEVRDSDGAERVLQTAITGDASRRARRYAPGCRHGPRVSRHRARARLHQQSVRVPGRGGLVRDSADAAESGERTVQRATLGRTERVAEPN